MRGKAQECLERRHGRNLGKLHSESELTLREVTHWTWCTAAGEKWTTSKAVRGWGAARDKAGG